MPFLLYVPRTSAARIGSPIVKVEVLILTLAPTLTATEALAVVVFIAPDSVVSPVTLNVFEKATFEVAVKAPVTFRYDVGIIPMFAEPVIVLLPCAIDAIELPTNTVVALANTFAPTATTV